jgi:hypothetical protein
MAADDREQQFARALTRLLRDASPASRCPDIEMLSAYHGRMLSAEETSACKEHIAACVLCQEILALVAQSENVQALEWQADNAPVAGPAATISSVAPREVGGESDVNKQSGAVTRVTPRVIKLRSRWRWLVPIGAAAAGVIAWVQVHEIRTQRSEQAATEMARNMQPEPTLSGPAAAPLGQVTKQGATQQQLATSPQDAIREQKKTSRVTPSAPQAIPEKIPENRTVPRSPAESFVSGLPKTSRSFLALTPEEPPTQAQTDRKQNVAPRAAPAGVPQPGGVAGGVVATPVPEQKQKSEVTAAEVNVAPSATSTTDVASSNGHLFGQVTDPSGALVAGASVRLLDANGALIATTSTDSSGNYLFLSLPPGRYRLEFDLGGFKKNVITSLNVGPGENQANSRLQVGATSETVSVSAASNELALQSNGMNLIVIAGSDSHYIVAPGDKHAWRVGEAGKIERSKDAGKTWKAQKSGVAVDLVAGSATSEKVCWIIGRGGAILLSTDAGKRWKRVTSPIAEDLSGIHATDALHATVWDANRNTFETSDGGATWTPPTKP